LKTTLLEASADGRLEENLSRIRGQSANGKEAAVPATSQDTTRCSTAEENPKAQVTEDIKEGVRECIQDVMKEQLDGAFTKVMGEFRAELAARDAKSQELADNVAALTQSVASIQAMVGHSAGGAE
jgi:hypothetical protein